MKRRYPLESLRSVRRCQVDEQAGEVARQAQRTRQAKQRYHAARRTREAEQERNRCVLGSERQRLEHGVARAGDLQQAEDFGRGAQQRESQLRKTERAAEQCVQAEQQTESSAHQALCEADADAKVVNETRALEGEAPGGTRARRGGSCRRGLRGAPAGTAGQGTPRGRGPMRCVVLVLAVALLACSAKRQPAGSHVVNR